ncbi:MAG TPA: UbiA family prenyltransferase [Acidisarcina sp.]
MRVLSPGQGSANLGVRGDLPSMEELPIGELSGDERAEDKFLNDKAVGRASRNAVPLCVDLDGTLVKSDTLWDSLLILVRSHPLKLLQLPQWLIGGKASFKRHVVSSVALDVACLPYNSPLLDYLQQEHQAGRSIYLATGADKALAERVADHLRIFDGVLASDGQTNLTGSNKLASLRERFGPFSYVGNAGPDLPLLRAAAEPMVANPNGILRSRLRSQGLKPSREFIDRRRMPAAIAKAIRVHQWPKNFLVFLPVLLAHGFTRDPLLRSLLAFACFSACASATYIVNDLLDLEVDRRHARKRRRPFAAGDLSAATGILMAGGLAAAAFLGAQWLSASFLFWLCIYAVSTLAYSLYIKRLALVDVLVLSGLYTLRVLAGGAAALVPISPWLAAFGIFFFLSLATAKRFAELEALRVAGATPKNGRGYLIGDLEQLRSFGTSSAYASVIVFSFYISNPQVAQLYHHPGRMWLMAPLLILWLNRVWLLASRGQLDEDPLIFALTDRVSLLLGLVLVGVAAAAAI